MRRNAEELMDKQQEETRLKVAKRRNSVIGVIAIARQAGPPGRCIVISSPSHVIHWITQPKEGQGAGVLQSINQSLGAQSRTKKGRKWMEQMQMENAQHNTPLLSSCSNAHFISIVLAASLSSGLRPRPPFVFS